MAAVSTAHGQACVDTKRDVVMILPHDAITKRKTPLSIQQRVTNDSTVQNSVY